MKKCLITVDYQVDFVNGSLGFDGAEKLENAIAEKIELCGLVSNICVISNAVLARTALPNARLTVDSNATASNDDGLNTAALNVMRGLGITVI